TRRRARTSCRPTPLPTPDTTAGCVASTVRRRACRRSPTARARASSARPPSCACGRRCVADAVENVVGPLDADTQLRDASLQRRTRQRAITVSVIAERIWSSFGSASANARNHARTESRPRSVRRYRPSSVWSTRAASVNRFSSWYTWLRVMFQKPLTLREIVDHTSAPDIEPSRSHCSLSGGGGPMSRTPRVQAAVELSAIPPSLGLDGCPIRTSNSRSRRTGGAGMETIDLVRRYYDEVWRNGDVDAIDELLSADHVDETPPPGLDGSREAQKQIAAAMRDTSRDKQLEILDIVADGDRATGVWRMEWTQVGDLWGMIPADGKRIELDGLDWFKI